jgi:DNA repair protein RadD
VTYHCGLITYREWICLEHSGYAHEKAVRWWSRREPGMVAPRNVTQALEICQQGSLPEPNAIMVRPAGKYFDIINHRF